MRQLIDQLKVAYAMRDRERGIVDYDRLAEAGLPGQIVLHNILGRVLDDATHSVDAPLQAKSEKEQDDVKLRMGGTTTYAAGGLMVAEGVVLSVHLPKSATEVGVTGTSMLYRLSNEPEEGKWGSYANVRQGDFEISGGFSGPFSDVKDRVASDYGHALADPAEFVTAAAGQFVNSEGMGGLERLSFLGYDAMMSLVAAATESQSPIEA